MCGLSAIAQFAPGSSLVPPLLAMHGKIGPRGPDGEGFALFDRDWQPHVATQAQAVVSLPARLGFAFRWLKIQDFDNAAGQPMASRDGRFWLIFNGEIYNFRDLRTELQALGHIFQTMSDTEVLLAAWTQWGKQALPRLIGMWAFLLFDRREKILFASRDRFGIKPLFYRLRGDTIAFASEAKQLLDQQPVADRGAVARFLLGGKTTRGEGTFFEDVLVVPTATCVEIDLSRARPELRFEPYWELETSTPPAGGRAARAQALDAVLRHTVGEHLIAQAPVGLMLSGGLDSSLIGALARQINPDSALPSVSMVPVEAALRYDESRHIDAVAQRIVSANHRATFSPEWLKDNLVRVSLAQEEPLAGMAVAAQFMTLETAAQHGIRVMLDGQGADEVFAGYPRHQLVRLRSLARQGRFVAMAGEMAAITWREPDFYGYLWRNHLARRLRGHRPSPDGELLRTAMQGLDTAPVPRPADLQATLGQDVVSGNLRAVLGITDRNAMAHSIEVRVPFIDPRVSAFAFGLADTDKIGGGRRKRILRMVAAPLLPNSVVSRPDKIGFGAPTEDWLRRHFSAELKALPHNPWLSQAMSARAVEALVRDFLAGRTDLAGSAWRLLALAAWGEAHNQSA